MLDMIAHHFPSGAATAARDPRHIVVTPYESVDVLYIDESAYVGQSGPSLAEIRAAVASTPFRLHIAKLEDAFEVTNDVAWMAQLDDVSLPVVPSTSQASAQDRLLSFLATEMHSATSISTLHAALVHTLLRYHAKRLGCEILFTGETATRLAVKCVSGIAQGRGYAIGEEIAASWNSGDGLDGYIMISRPMSALLSKEVAYYLRFKNISNGSSVEGRAARLPAKSAGVEALVEEFIVGLDAEFPSTVPTILRTSQKLGMRSAAKNTQTHVCPVCGLPSQQGAWNWRYAITISKFDQPAQTALGTSAADDSLGKDDNRDLKLTPLLCYSCLLVMQNPKGPPREHSALRLMPLPRHVYGVIIRNQEEAANPMDRLRKEIDDFLIEDDV
ncbi:Cytoplasmic tRNA 2-thiolation protein 2 [Microbotryomycetes sp. JL201]|nr:Cytoplasmic tRNA 2-thiolation protein 2 [Microbotryomycetes sp. JL201]